MIDRGIVVDNARQFLSARMRERTIERVPVAAVLLAGNWRDRAHAPVAPFFSGVVRLSQRITDLSEARP